ncbi:hypothetical protein [Hyunsoonleella pacifica]|uniref:Lipoprotein n=1 Tax=Hyunsoonleella pacifica TaxID=1080224 RepID=A0A4Q9FUX6_9FLAO|nr:hypothetical protein [Hyunsoonleella pacifica]TBN17859.1 hypothetical protein EYD46_05980 [Hyunsoonleella pacifica]GGD08264.1 hypothetical protein GCM10011368_07830 [Hyunsoonleella pacifica]
MQLTKYAFLLLSLCLTFTFVSCNIEPFDGEIPEQTNTNLPSSCDEATLNTANAAQAFAEASSSSENYSDLCSAYKAALEHQIELCGDDDGVFQTLINSLNCGDGNSGGETPSVTVRAFMTANINGQEYNDMKPNGYLFFPGGVSVNDFLSRPDDDYILIQGNSGYTKPTILADTDREINLRIPKPLWKEGSYVLYDEFNDVFEGVCFYTFFGLNKAGEVSTKELPGEIVISKFDLDERVITGTFKFEYILVYEDGTPDEGPYEVTGTFDYSLDDEFFD